MDAVNNNELDHETEYFNESDLETNAIENKFIDREDAHYGVGVAVESDFVVGFQSKRVVICFRFEKRFLFVFYLVSSYFVNRCVIKKNRKHSRTSTAPDFCVTKF